MAEYKKELTTWAPKKFSVKFFEAVNIDYSNININNPNHVSGFIKQNINKISKKIFNDINEGKNIFRGEMPDDIQSALGLESMRLIKQKQIELKQSVSELCVVIKIDDMQPRESFDLAGITYDHGNLPPECDGLF